MKGARLTRTMALFLLLLLLLHVSLHRAAAASDASFRHIYYCLRHGESQANVEGVISSDPTVACIEHGLSERGWDQAEKSVQTIVNEAHAKDVQGVVIVSSDLRRAWQTASVVRAGLLAKGLRTWPPDRIFEERALRERSFGELSGQSDDRYKDVWVEDAMSADHECFGCESVRSVQERGRGVVERVEALTDGELGSPGRWMVLLVAHGDVLQILQTAFAEVDPRTHRSLEHLPTATLRRLPLPQSWLPLDEAVVSSKWKDAASWPPAEVRGWTTTYWM